MRLLEKVLSNLLNTIAKSHPITDMSFRHAVFQNLSLNHFLKHRLKYDHGAVRKIAVHLEANIQRLILVLMDGNSVYQHSEISIGYSAIREYVIKQHRGACKGLLPLPAYLIILATVGYLLLKLRDLVFALFNHAVVEFRARFIRYLAHYQVLYLLFQCDDFFFVLPNL